MITSPTYREGNKDPEKLVICPSSHSWLVVELEFKPRHSGSKAVLLTAPEGSKDLLRVLLCTGGFYMSIFCPIIPI